MNEFKSVSRRNLILKLGSASLGVMAAKALGNACGISTPAQTEGPFYPDWDSSDEDTDLTRIVGHAETARGQLVEIKGTVLDENCEPVSGAIVEIWQACAEGRYNHESDPNTSVPLDPNFQYWGRTTTSKEGEYKFRTIRPGAYPAANDWWRPPHIHFKVIAPGFRTLTTQMYFKGDPLNERDLILQNLHPRQRELVIVEFQKNKNRVLQGEFDIYLSSKPTTNHTPFLD